MNQCIVSHSNKSGTNPVFHVSMAKSTICTLTPKCRPLICVWVKTTTRMDVLHMQCKPPIVFPQQMLPMQTTSNSFWQYASPIWDKSVVLWENDYL